MSLKNPKIESFNELKQLTQIIKTKHSYDFSEYALPSFKRRIERYLSNNKIEDTTTLINLLLSDQINTQDFLSELTVNVTEMFRDPSMWKFLKENTLPNLISKTSALKVLHAGCSSGEEVYSLKIILDQLSIKSNCIIDAFDLDKSIINQAQQGTFHQKDLKKNNANFQETGATGNLLDFLNKSDNHYSIDETLKRGILFSEADLISCEIDKQYDLIFCRNLLIYFNQPLQNKVLKKIVNALKPNGILIIGFNESISWCESYFDLKCVNINQRIFKKKQISVHQ